MSRRIRNLIVAAAVAAGVLSATGAQAAIELKPLPRSVEQWPFGCDPARHQYVIDAGNNYTMGTKFMCLGKGDLDGPGWWHRGWPGLVDGGQHYMSVYDAPTVPDSSTAAEYSPTITVPGLYEIWVSFRTTHNRADDAPYYVYADDGKEYVAHVNQKGGPGEDGFRAVRLTVDGKDTRFFLKRHAMEKVVVRLVNSEGTHSKGADAVFIRYTGPQDVRRLTASNATATDAITLNWSPVAGASHYRIYRSRTNNIANAKVIKAVKAPVRTYVDQGINEGKTWYYWVKAVGPMNLASRKFSNVAAGKTGRTPAVPVVAMSATTLPTANTLTIEWSDLANATSYRIFRGTSDVFADAEFVDAVTDTDAAAYAYTDQGLAPDTQYWYFLVAANAIAESAPSAPATGTTLLGPAAPIFEAPGVETDSVSLAWSAVDGAIAYRLYRSATELPQDAVFLAEVLAPTTDYTDEGLPPGTDWWYYVTTVSAEGEGVRSGVAAASIP